MRIGPALMVSVAMLPPALSFPRFRWITSLLVALALDAAIASATTWSVRDFGATGNGTTRDTAAIQKTLDAAAAHGGGEVRVPAGRYLTGSLVLGAHTTLHLAAGAVLLGTANPGDYPLVQARWEGIERPCHRALVSASHVDDVAITGAGTIEGNPVVSRLRDPRGPAVIELIGCNHVRVQGITLRSTHIWTLHPTFCQDVRIAQVTFETSGANSDGIDPDSCRHVVITGCTFTTGDDSIAIKSGKGQEGVRIGRPCEDVDITDCTFLKGYTSIAFGSELSGGIRHVRISHCTFQHGRAALQLKSRPGRGGYVEDVRANHLVVGPEPLIEITGDYGYNPDPQGVPGPAGITAFRDIQITDVRINATRLMNVLGPAAKPVDGLRISNVKGTCQQGSVIQNARDVILTGIDLRGIAGPAYLTRNAQVEK